MSLSESIDERVWSAVQVAYESGNYSAAILDSILYLGELIRNKSGLDSDGNNLVGSAFGGPNPIVKVNALHTESERDEQRGVEQLLRGVYTAIRNPRSHGKRTDTAETADVLIAFVAWTATLIDKSKSPFDTEQIIKSVFDRHFALNDRYAELLVDRIPKRKRMDIVVEVFHRRTEGSWKGLSLFLQAVLRTMATEEQDKFWQIVSEAIEGASTDADFRSAIQLAKENWTKLSEFSRLRAEYRLIESASEGEYDTSRSICPKGSLGTWASEIGKQIVLKDELVSAIIGRLWSDDSAARAYGLKYFLHLLTELKPIPSTGLVMSLRRRLREQDEDVYKALSWTSSPFANSDDGWVKAFQKDIEAFEAAASASITEDDIPF